MRHHLGQTPRHRATFLWNSQPLEPLPRRRPESRQEGVPLPGACQVPDACQPHHATNARRPAVRVWPGLRSWLLRLPARESGRTMSAASPGRPAEACEQRGRPRRDRLRGPGSSSPSTTTERSAPRPAVRASELLSTGTTPTPCSRRTAPTPTADDSPCAQLAAGPGSARRPTASPHTRGQSDSPASPRRPAAPRLDPASCAQPAEARHARRRSVDQPHARRQAP